MGRLNQIGVVALSATAHLRIVVQEGGLIDVVPSKSDEENVGLHLSAIAAEQLAGLLNRAAAHVRNAVVMDFVSAQGAGDVYQP